MDKKKVIIVTHSSKFHTDDVFAVATLFLALEKEFEIEVIRSREKEVIEKGDFIVDTGGIYDSEKNKFDHHQIGAAGVRENGIPYASFGLVWKKYGEIVCGDVIVARQIDEKLVQPIDANDSGIQTFSVKIPGVYPYEVRSVVNSFLPTWDEGMNQSSQAFMQAVEFAKGLLLREIKRHVSSLKAKEIVRKTYIETEDKRLIVFDGFYSAGKHIGEFPEPLFIVFPDVDGKWILEAILVEPESFVYRKLLPEAWAGKTGAELEKVTGVVGGTFCHNHRYIAVAKTREAILKMAEIALNS